MSIFIDSTSRVIVQGMTGSEGQKHTTRMLAAGTNIVGGVNPRKAGTIVTFNVDPYGPGAEDRAAGEVEVPVFGSVAHAREETGANVSVIFVPRHTQRMRQLKQLTLGSKPWSSSPKAFPFRIQPLSLITRLSAACA